MKKKFIISLLLLMIVSVINSYYGRYYLDSYSNYFIKEIVWFVGGLIIIYSLSKVNISFILDKSLYLYLIGIVLLIVTLIWGVNVNGSTSWIKIFGFSFQPSEFMKVFLILYLRYITVNCNLSDFKYVIVTMIITLIPSLLVFLEPDTGPVISYLVIFITFLIMKKLDKWYYIFGVSVILICIVSFIYLYRPIVGYKKILILFLSIIVLIGVSSIIYSLIVEMFKISKHTLSENEIIDKVTKDNKWVYKYYWTKNQRKKFENELTEIFKNVYYYTGKELAAHVQMWMINYGLSIKGNNMFD